DDLCQLVESPGRWEEFLAKWRSIRLPPGAAWRAAIERSHTVEAPAELQGGPLERLSKVLIALAEARGGENFFVAVRDLEAPTALAYKTVHRRLGALGALGYLELVEPGDNVPKRGAKANTYRWRDPPVEGGAPWAKARDRKRG